MEYLNEACARYKNQLQIVVVRLKFIKARSHLPRFLLSSVIQFEGLARYCDIACSVTGKGSDSTSATLRATISSNFRGWSHLIETIARNTSYNVT